MRNDFGDLAPIRSTVLKMRWGSSESGQNTNAQCGIILPG